MATLFGLGVASILFNERLRVSIAVLLTFLPYLQRIVLDPYLLNSGSAELTITNVQP